MRTVLFLALLLSLTACDKCKSDSSQSDSGSDSGESA